MHAIAKTKASEFILQLEAQNPEDLNAIQDIFFQVDNKLVAGANNTLLRPGTSTFLHMSVLECCLTTLDKARQIALLNGAGSTLTAPQFNAALTWLRDTFRKKWMTNFDLRMQLVQKDNGELDLDESDEVDRKFNSEFTSFFCSLTGNMHFGLAMLRHGCSTAEAIKNVMAEYHKHKHLNKNEKLLAEERQEKQQLKAMEIKACFTQLKEQRAHDLVQELKDNPKKQFSGHEKRLLKDLQTGKLEEEMKKCKRAFRF